MHLRSHPKGSPHSILHYDTVVPFSWRGKMLICSEFLYFFHFQQYVFVVGCLLGFLVNASINVWCMIASQMGESHISGAISAFVSFLANCEHMFSFPGAFGCFIVFCVLDILLLIVQFQLDQWWLGRRLLCSLTTSATRVSCPFSSVTLQFW